MVGTGFLPEADEGGFVIDYLTPAGTALEETNRILQGVEGILQQTPDVAAFTRRTGSELGLFATQQNKGDILVRLEAARNRRRSAEEIISDLRDKLTETAPQLEIEFVQLLQDMIGDLEGTPTPIEVKVFGDDADVLAEISEQNGEAARAESTASSTSSACSAAIPRRRGRSIRSAPDGWASPWRRCHRSSRTPGSAASERSYGLRTARFRCAFATRMRTA